MMTQDEQNTVKKVFQRFAESDRVEQGWTDIDEQMSMLEWLDDNQLAIEAAVLIQIQSNGEPRCNQDHPVANCFVPTIIEATQSILNLYSNTGNLHPNNSFILRYYLALSQVGFIIY